MGPAQTCNTRALLKDLFHDQARKENKKDPSHQQKSDLK